MGKRRNQQKLTLSTATAEQSCRAHQPPCKDWHYLTSTSRPFSCSDISLAKYRLFIATILGHSHAGENSPVCSSSPFTTATHFLTGFVSLHTCWLPCGTHGPSYLNTSSFTNAISRLAKRGPRQCKHHTPTHENFRINDSCSEAAVWVAAV